MHPKKSLGAKIVSGIVWGQVGMSLRSLISFAVYILISRSLNVHDFGLYSAIVSLIAILLYFTNMGIYSVFNNYLPQLESKKKRGADSYLIRWALLAKTTIFTIVAIGIHQYIGLLADWAGAPSVKDYVFLLILWFFFRSIADFFMYILMSRMAMKYYALVETSISIIQLAGLAYLIKTEINISSLVALMVVVYGIQCLLYTYGSRKSYLVEPQKINLAPVVKYALIIWLTTVIRYFLEKDIDIYMILYFLKDSALVGYYNIAFLISTTGGYFLLSSISSLCLTILSKSYAKMGIAGLRTSMGFLYKISLLLSAPIFAFMIFQADNVITCLFSSKYSEAGVLLIFLALFNLLASFLGGGYLITALLPLNKEKILMYLRCAGGMLNFILNLVLIPIFGLIGAVAATGISFFLLVTVELYMVTRLADFRLPVTFLGKIIPVVVIPAFLSQFWDPASLLGLILCALLYGITVSVFALALYPLGEDEWGMLKDLSPRAVKIMTKFRLSKQLS